ncbi:hydantoinase/oxoprolinase family protein [Neorhodopirellula lusitana]|uniref:hydantoinase/oxoprolinase family protein n=1 Tax=Neorhodopirellula lusitana TaxID=445327 RepID=UPI00384DC1F8
MAGSTGFPSDRGDVGHDASPTDASRATGSSAVASDHVAGNVEAGSVIGVDIGGANLKYSTSDGRCVERSFEMWKRWQCLRDQLASDLRQFSECWQTGETPRLAVTMTGELADCFDSRREGVRFIVDAVVASLPAAGLSEARFYSTSGCFLAAESAKDGWEHVAASNWHALTSCFATRGFSDSLLIDVGSTTADVIAIRNGTLATEAKTDFERLRDQSLVYVGCRRTPVCSLVSALRFRGSEVAVMREVFATVGDARLLLGEQAEDSQDCFTADGKPSTRAHARVRMARMIGLDHDELTDSESLDLAKQVRKAASRIIGEAVSRWCDGNESAWVLSGHGQDMVEVPAGVVSVDLRTELPAGVSRVAPAWAVAELLQLNLRKRSAR